MTLIQDLHAAISRRDWSAVEVAANRLRDADLEKLLASKSEECANLANSLDGSEHARSELTARVKELDRCHEGTIDLCNQKTAEIKALEAKLAAAEKALMIADEALQADAIASAHAAIRAVLGRKP